RSPMRRRYSATDVHTLRYGAAGRQEVVGVSGWVETLPSGLHRARYRAPDGRTVSSPTFRLKRDAGEWLDGQVGDMARGAWVDPRAGRQTFGSWADEWAKVQDGWGDSTRDWWRAMRARLDARIGDVPLAAVDRMVLLRLRADLAETYAARTVAQTMTY